MPTTPPTGPGPLDQILNLVAEDALRMRFEDGRVSDCADDDLFEIVQEHTPTSPNVLRWLLDADPTLGSDEPSEVWAPYHHGANETEANLIAAGTTSGLQRVAANVSSRLESLAQNVYQGDMTEMDEVTVVVTVAPSAGLTFHCLTMHKQSLRPASSSLAGLGGQEES